MSRRADESDYLLPPGESQRQVELLRQLYAPRPRREQVPPAPAPTEGSEPQ